MVSVVDETFAYLSFVDVMFMEEVGFEDKFVADFSVFVGNDREVFLEYIFEEVCVMDCFDWNILNLFGGHIGEV